MGHCSWCPSAPIGWCEHGHDGRRLQISPVANQRVASSHMHIVHNIGGFLDLAREEKLVEMWREMVMKLLWVQMCKDKLAKDGTSFISNPWHKVSKAPCCSHLYTHGQLHNVLCCLWCHCWCFTNYCKLLFLADPFCLCEQTVKVKMVM